MSQALNWRSSWFALALIMLLLLAGGIVFAHAQNVWIDESTQLSGITLAPGALLHWLGGTRIPEFGVPPDRMPPVSYLFDSALYGLWGGNVLAFRIAHLLVAALGVLVLLRAINRRMGARAMVVTGLLLALSPRLIDAAVEIRAYPLFFAITCVQLSMALRERERWAWPAITGFALLGLLSGYTHFFGVVATSAITVGIAVTLKDRASFMRLCIAYAVMLAAWTGLAPFITGASSISSDTETASFTPGGIVTWFLKLVGHSANLLSPVGAGLYLLGAFGLMGLAKLGFYARLRRKGLEARTHPIAVLLAALAAGLGVTLLAALVIKGFNPLKPSYSIWSLPLLAALAGAVFTPRLAPKSPLFRAGRAGLLVLMLVGAAWGQWSFLGHAGWFVHGPERAIRERLEQAPQGAALVYAGNDWGYGYFPLAWRSKGMLDQWLLSSDGATVHRIGRGGDPDTAAEPLSALDRYPALVVARITPSGYLQLRDAPDDATIGAAPVAEAAALAERWRSQPAAATPGLYWLTTQTFERRSIR